MSIVRNSDLFPSFDWEVKEVAVGIENENIFPEDGQFDTTKRYKALVKSSDNDLLSIVSSRYVPIPNSFLEETTYRLSDVTGMRVAGFQQWGHGEVVFGYLESEGKLAGLDVKDYMIVGNSFNKKFTLFTGTANQILRCDNQFGRISQHHKVYHSAGYQMEVDSLIQYYEQHLKNRDIMEADFLRWQEVKIDQNLREAMIQRVLDIDLKEERSSRMENLLQGLNVSIDRETHDLGDNLFGLFNGVTHWTTHVKTGRKTLGNVLGGASTANNRAYAFAEVMAS